MAARSRRTEITADRVVVELAKIAFAIMQDYWPKNGERIDLSRVDQDCTAAVEELTVIEEVGTDGVRRRRTHVRLADKLAALTSLARHLGMFADRRLVAGSSIEQRIVSMTPQERVTYVNELLEGAPLHAKGERGRNRKDEAEPRPIDQK
jgi:phage terminase small subunit